MSFCLPEISSEMKKDDYRQYLDRHCIVAKLTSIFEVMNNMENKPEDPLNYIREHLGDKPISKDEINHMRFELEDLQIEIRKLRKILRDLGAEDKEIDLDCNESAPEDNEESAEKSSSSNNSGATDY